jgi:hypothetical protein
MKKLAIILQAIILIAMLIAISITAKGQDTTVVFTDTTITKWEHYLLFESEWKMDSSNFDIAKDSIFPPCKWMRKDSIYVNENRYKIIEIQKSKNAQGIKRRRIRRIRYHNETRTKTIIRY